MCRVVTYRTSCAHEYREDTELEVENCAQFQKTKELCNVTRFATYEFGCLWCRSQAQGGLYPGKNSTNDMDAAAATAEASQKAKKRLDLDEAPKFDEASKSSLWQKTKKLVVRNP